MKRLLAISLLALTLASCSGGTQITDADGDPTGLRYHEFNGVRCITLYQNAIDCDWPE